ncbi:MAG: DNA adenine methylase [Candidatus Promineifilaceae bacterium]
MKIKSPLRYPGGKSKAIPQIVAYIPSTFKEYREPLVGGGSLFIYLRQRYPQVRMWINDINYDLFCFWKYAQHDSHKLANEIKKIKDERQDGHVLFHELKDADVKTLSDFERAVRFFVLNRIGFSGTVDAGGFSQYSFISRFTYSSIERLARLGSILEGVKITNLDYKEVLREQGENVFIFLDPPYLKATKSRLYGKNGILHVTFDHDEFANEVRKCRHAWLITYDDSPEIRANFSFANIYEWELQYGMNNYKQASAAKGRELFITNYLVKHHGDQLRQTKMQFPP